MPKFIPFYFNFFGRCPYLTPPCTLLFWFCLLYEKCVVFFTFLKESAQFNDSIADLSKRNIDRTSSRISWIIQPVAHISWDPNRVYLWWVFDAVLHCFDYLGLMALKTAYLSYFVPGKCSSFISEVSAIKKHTFKWRWSFYYYCRQLFTMEMASGCLRCAMYSLDAL